MILRPEAPATAVAAATTALVRRYRRLDRATAATAAAAAALVVETGAVRGRPADGAGEPTAKNTAVGGSRSV